MSNQSITRRHFIKTTAGLTVGLLGGATVIQCGGNRGDFDMIIRGGMLYDGMGGAPHLTDIGIRGNRIMALGNLSRANAERLIDADGMAVAPGFIDAHSHSDIGLLVNPNAESKIRQGVTTEVSGNCGDSPFPLFGSEGDRFRKNIREDYGIDVAWSDADGFLSFLEQHPAAVNYATFLGHGSLRAAVMGVENRPPKPEELTRMQMMVRQAMEQGCLGLSTGLEYTPGNYADTEEVIALCREAADVGGIYATHMRSEDVKLLEAIDETLHIGQEADIPIQISHLKASQKRNWHKLDAVLEKLQTADQQGLRVNADRYAYPAWSTTLQILFPMWSREGETEDFIARLKDNVQWKKIRVHVEDKVNAMGSWESVMISRVDSETNQIYQGKTVAALAKDARRNPSEFARRLIIEENGSVGIVGFAMSPENTEKVLAFPLTMIGSDGSALAPYGELSKGNPHPRNYGCFPRYLGHYIRDRQILPLEEAVRRITSLPARKFGLLDRGHIAKNKFADIVIFNPETVVDKATFTNPHQYPEGIPYVIVNGSVVIESGEHTGKRAGKVIRRMG